LVPASLQLAHSGDKPVTCCLDPTSGTLGLPWCVYEKQMRGSVWTPCGDAGDNWLNVKQEMLHGDHVPSSQEYALHGGFAGHEMDLLAPQMSLEGGGTEVQTGESRLFEPVIVAVLKWKAFNCESKEHPGGEFTY